MSCPRLCAAWRACPLTQAGSRRSVSAGSACPSSRRPCVSSQRPSSSTWPRVHKRDDFLAFVFVVSRKQILSHYTIAQNQIRLYHSAVRLMIMQSHDIVLRRLESPHQASDSGRGCHPRGPRMSSPAVRARIRLKEVRALELPATTGAFRCARSRACDTNIIIVYAHHPCPRAGAPRACGLPPWVGLRMQARYWTPPAVVC